MQRPVVVLPHPLSPTSPSTSPCVTANDTPSTARTWPTVRENRPFLIGKCFLRSVTSRMVVMIDRRVQQDPAYAGWRRPPFEQLQGVPSLNRGTDPPGTAPDRACPPRSRAHASSGRDGRRRSLRAADPAGTFRSSRGTADGSGSRLEIEPDSGRYRE